MVRKLDEGMEKILGGLESKEVSLEDRRGAVQYIVPILYGSLRRGGLSPAQWGLSRIDQPSEGGHRELLRARGQLGPTALAHQVAERTFQVMNLLAGDAWNKKKRVDRLEECVRFACNMRGWFWLQASRYELSLQHRIHNDDFFEYEVRETIKAEKFAKKNRASALRLLKEGKKKQAAQMGLPEAMDPKARAKALARSKQPRLRYHDVGEGEQMALGEALALEGVSSSRTGISTNLAFWHEQHSDFLRNITKGRCRLLNPSPDRFRRVRTPRKLPMGVSSDPFNKHFDVVMKVNPQIWGQGKGPTPHCHPRKGAFNLAKTSWELDRQNEPVYKALRGGGIERLEDSFEDLVTKESFHTYDTKPPPSFARCRVVVPKDPEKAKLKRKPVEFKPTKGEDGKWKPVEFFFKSSFTTYYDLPFSGKELKDIGFAPAQLKAVGFSAAHCRGAGFSARACKDARFSAAECRDAGFTVQEALDAGFQSDQLIRAGFLESKTAPSDEGSGGDENSGHWVAHVPITFYHLADGSGWVHDFHRRCRCKPTYAEEVPIFGQTITVVRQGCNTGKLSDGGDMKVVYSAGEMKSAGFTASDLKREDFTVADMKDVYSIEETKSGGSGAREMIQASEGDCNTENRVLGAVATLKSHDYGKWKSSKKLPTTKEGGDEDTKRFVDRSVNDSDGEDNADVARANRPATPTGDVGEHPTKNLSKSASQEQSSSVKEDQMPQTEFIESTPRHIQAGGEAAFPGAVEPANGGFMETTEAQLPSRPTTSAHGRRNVRPFTERMHEASASSESHGLLSSVTPLAPQSPAALAPIGAGGGGASSSLLRNTADLANVTAPAGQVPRQVGGREHGVGLERIDH